MTYDKPAIVALGCALKSVQTGDKPEPVGFDSIFNNDDMTPTAYQADE